MSDTLQLKQTGRALMEFEVSARQLANQLHRTAESELSALGIVSEELPDELSERRKIVDSALAESRTFRLRHILGDYCWREHGRAALAAFAEIEDELPQEDLSSGSVKIDENPDFEPPAYWATSRFHRTEGGWDGHARMGEIHGEIVHKQYVAKIFPGDIYANRRAVASKAPRKDYSAILEIGVSSGHYTVALSDIFPDAQIHGVDPSLRMLEQAARVGNARGSEWKLKVATGESTGYDDARFDLVTAYAVHHEMPPKAIDAMFHETFRILKPGGDLIFADVPRYADIDKLSAWRFDWLGRHGGEPFWTPSAMLDLATMAQAPA